MTETLKAAESAPTVDTPVRTTGNLLEKIRARRERLQRATGYKKNPYQDPSPEYLVLSRQVPRYKNTVGYAEPFRDIKKQRDHRR